MVLGEYLYDGCSGVSGKGYTTGTVLKTLQNNIVSQALMDIRIMLIKKA